MRSFAETYQDFEFVQQVVAQIPWRHNIRILDTVKNATERKWYIRQTIEQGWSRNVLVHQIESGLYKIEAGLYNITDIETMVAYLVLNDENIAIFPQKQVPKNSKAKAKGMFLSEPLLISAN